ncbi:MAG: class I SAM-dependent methyltransferase [Pseudomonadota bacterium]
MTQTGHRRRPHAVLDLPSRELKAKKIERLLRLSERPQPVRLLEIGAGSGGVAHYFGTHPDLQCSVTAVDVCDNRVVRDAYEYLEVTDVELPFGSDSFDVVISNHVIEHVGDTHAQRKHLAEIHRPSSAACRERSEWHVGWS